MSSRIIVKNLPKKLTEDRFRQHFAKLGQITDAKLKFTKEGKFRNFGFIGYKSAEEAQKAIEYFNGTYIDATKINVEECMPLNDPGKPRAWSKYSSGSTANRKLVEKTEKKATNDSATSNEDAAKKIKENKKIKKIEELLGPLKDDEEFKEFVHATKAIKAKDSIWKNDIDFTKVEGDAKASENKQSDGNSDTLKDADDKKETKRVDDDEADFENGRLFVRNLCYSCKEEDLEQLFDKYKPIVEVNMPIDNFSKKPKGYAYVTFMFPEHAVKTFNEFDGTIFQGRMLHIIPAKSKEEAKEDQSQHVTLKSKRETDKKKTANSGYNWNTLFVNQDAIANLMSQKYNIDKAEIFSVQGKGSAAVKLAVGETQIVNDIRKFLIRNGVKLDAFSNPSGERSKNVILVKNLPFNTAETEVREMFEKFGVVKRCVMPEYGIGGLVELQERQEARQAFMKLAYRKFKNVPIYLEWAPVDVFDANESDVKQILEEDKKDSGAQENASVEKEKKNEDEEDESEPESNVFIKNLNFDTTEEALESLFKQIGKCRATIARKISANQQMLSMGYGFVQFKKHSQAVGAIKEYQDYSLDGHNLELKLSNKQSNQQANDSSKRKLTKNEHIDKTSKIMVRNIPFEAKAKEIEELFKVFGELKYVRLPKKIDGTHRGFGFVEFLTINDAKRAFDALCHSTHLFGRRLVLEWSAPEQTQDVEILRLKEAQLSGPVAKKLKKSTFLKELGGDDEITGGDFNGT